MSIAHQMDSSHAWRAATWQMRIGWGAAAATLVARLTTVVWQVSGGPLDPVRLGLALFKSSLLIAVVLCYGRYRWPAYLMLAVWPFGFLLAWQLAHAPPPVMAVGLLVGVAFFLGARGVRIRHALRASAPHSAAHHENASQRSVGLRRTGIV